VAATSPYSRAQRQKFRKLATAFRVAKVMSVVFGLAPLCIYYLRIPQLRSGSDSAAEAQFYFGLVSGCIGAIFGCIFHWLAENLLRKTKGVLK
jgi:hypothetical protein